MQTIFLLGFGIHYDMMNTLCFKGPNEDKTWPLRAPSRNEPLFNPSSMISSWLCHHIRRHAHGSFSASFFTVAHDLLRSWSLVERQITIGLQLSSCRACSDFACPLISIFLQSYSKTNINSRSMVGRHFVLIDLAAPISSFNPIPRPILM
jgi:hypothetical protein